MSASHYSSDARMESPAVSEPPAEVTSIFSVEDPRQQALIRSFEVPNIEDEDWVFPDATPTLE